MDYAEQAQSVMSSRFAEVERVVAGIPETARRLAEVRVSQTSADGLVTATVDMRGRLLELRLDPRIYRIPDADALADSIVRQTAEATERAAAAGESLLRDLLPRSGDLAFSDADLRSMLGRTDPVASPAAAVPGDQAWGVRRG